MWKIKSGAALALRPRAHPLPHSDYRQILIITSMPPYLMTPAALSWSPAASSHCKLQQGGKNKKKYLKNEGARNMKEAERTKDTGDLNNSVVPVTFRRRRLRRPPRPSENLWAIARDVIMLTEQPPQKRYRIFHAILQHCIVFRAYSRATGTLWTSALP